MKKSKVKTVSDPLEILMEKHPDIYNGIKQVQEQQLNLLASKLLDYGIDNISMGKDLEKPDYRRRSLMGVWFRMNDKINRLWNLLENPNKPQHEPIEDSYIDLANYSIISLIVLKNKWK